MDINTKNHSAILANQNFDSFEQLSYLIKQWDSDFRQLSNEKFKSKILQVVTGSILISDVYFGCHVEVKGSTPPGMRTFSVQGEDSPEQLWFGHIVNKDDLLIFPTNGEVEAFTRTRFDVATISIPNDLLAEFFYRNGVDNISKIFGPEEIIKKTSKLNMNKLRYLIKQLKQTIYVSQTRHSADFSALNSGLEYQILQLIFNIMIEDFFQKNKLLNHQFCKSNPQKLRMLIDYIHTNDCEQLRMEQLVHVAQVSERTLQYLFKQELGMSPKAYLKGQKLYKVHKILWNSKQPDTEIRDIANQFGFWHMGQFAADYRKVFGELPSATLKRTGTVI